MSPRRAAAGCPVTFVAFDLLHLDGTDLHQRPYRERRALLEGLALDGPCWRTVDVLDCDPEDALAACAELGFEGVVAKRADSRYLPGRRSPHWLKLKCPGWRAEHLERRVQR